MKGLCACLVMLVALPAAGQPVLCPPHVVGTVAAEEVERFVASFAAEVEALGGDPLHVAEGEACAVPSRCPAAAGEVRYWLQISGPGPARIAVAIRLDGSGQVAARSDAEGVDVEVLGATLAAAVAAGPSPGLDVSTGRLRGALVSLDGDPLGRTPLQSDEPLPSGLHLLRIETRDGRTALSLVQARVGERTRLELDLSGVPRGKKVGAWPLLPVLLGGATVAILLATDPAGVIGPDYRLTVVTP